MVELRVCCGGKAGEDASELGKIKYCTRARLQPECGTRGELVLVVARVHLPPYPKLTHFSMAVDSAMQQCEFSSNIMFKLEGH